MAISFPARCFRAATARVTPTKVPSGRRRGCHSMTEREEHIGRLFTAELQFRLASAVRLATTRGKQPLDLPIEWTHGKHRAKYQEIALRQDQADYAAFF